MAFYPWIDTLQVGQNCQSAETFGGDSERANGFSAGDVASSIRVNTALRQANLIACALMSAIGDTTHSVESTVGDVAQSIRDHIAVDLPYYLVNQNFSIYTPLEMDSVDSRGCFSICNNMNAKNKIRNGHSNCYFFGEGLESYGRDQFLIGTYNGAASSTDILIVGSGSPIDRQNALRLNFDGGLWIGGNLTVGGNYGNSASLTEEGVNLINTVLNANTETENGTIYLTPGVYSFEVKTMIGDTIEVNVIFDIGESLKEHTRYSQAFYLPTLERHYCLRATATSSSSTIAVSVIQLSSGTEPAEASPLGWPIRAKLICGTFLNSI